MTPEVAVESLAAPEAATASGRRLLFWLAPTATAMYALFNGIQQILLPGQIDAIDSVHKIGNLGLIMTGAAIASGFGLLAGGAISDRTTGRWGSRTPSLVVSAVVTAAATVAMSSAFSVAMLAASMAAIWFSLNYGRRLVDQPLDHREP